MLPEEPASPSGRVPVLSRSPHSSVACSGICHDSPRDAFGGVTGKPHLGAFACCPLCLPVTNRLVCSGLMALGILDFKAGNRGQIGHRPGSPILIRVWVHEALLGERSSQTPASRATSHNPVSLVPGLVFYCSCNKSLQIYWLEATCIVGSQCVGPQSILVVLVVSLLRVSKGRNQAVSQAVCLIWRLLGEPTSELRQGQVEPSSLRAWD